MATLPVKYYHSGMPGAPILGNNFGDLTALLDACLVNGYALNAIASLTSSAGVATATVTAGHGYQMDQVVLIAGAGQAAYNGEFRILTTTETTFTFAVVGTPVSPATGSISVKVAPLNFDIAFTALNKRAYRSRNVQSNRPFLRVDNAKASAYTATFAKKGKVSMAESMTSVDLVVGASAPYDPVAPTRGTGTTGTGVDVVDGWFKWYHALSGYAPDGESVEPPEGARSWVLMGDDRGFFFYPEVHPGSGRLGYCFTDFSSYKAGDAFNTLLCATDMNAVAGTWNSLNPRELGNYMNRTQNAAGKVLMRDHLQVGGNVRASLVSLGTHSGTAQMVTGMDTGVPWPNGPDYSLVLHPVYLQQENGHLRGKIPGMMW